MQSRRLLIGAVFLISLAASQMPVTAQETSDRNIGVLVVDIQRIQRDAAAATSVREQSAAMRLAPLAKKKQSWLSFESE